MLEFPTETEKDLEMSKKQISILCLVSFGLIATTMQVANAVVFKITNVSDSYFDYGTSYTFQDPNYWYVANAKSAPTLQAKPSGTWMVKVRGIATRDLYQCPDKKHPFVVTYKWKIDEMGQAISGHLHTNLQMRTIAGKISYPFTLPVYPTGYQPDYLRALQCMDHADQYSPEYCAQD